MHCLHLYQRFRNCWVYKSDTQNFWADLDCGSAFRADLAVYSVSKPSCRGLNTNCDAGSLAGTTPPTGALSTRRSSGSAPFPQGLKVSTLRTDRDGSVTPKHGDRSPGTATSGQSERLKGDNPFLGRVDRLYLMLISMHGLVRGENMELGKDADTGGQARSPPNS